KDLRSNWYVIPKKSSRFVIGSKVVPPKRKTKESVKSVEAVAQALPYGIGEMFVRSVHGGDSVSKSLPTSKCDKCRINWNHQVPEKKQYRQRAYIKFGGLILYIGGKEFTGLTVQTVALNNITTYDFNNYTWGAVAASSESTFENRFGHSSVITLDDLVFCYGGAKLNDTAVSNQLIILNVTASPYKWFEPTVSWKSPPGLFYHSADSVGDFMIIA
ncbi:14736_t:CDS:2, partial [Acaulospora morrowiae]